MAAEFVDVEETEDEEEDVEEKMKNKAFDDDDDNVGGSDECLDRSLKSIALFAKRILRVYVATSNIT